MAAVIDRAQQYLQTLSPNHLKQLQDKDSLRRELAQQGLDLDTLSDVEKAQLLHYIEGKITSI